ncbi:hypothetical protein PCL_05055 [Purpureocillium lilacinum]|uniref:DUF7704 domain-containing protein n=1 Tax=Purpureocillium lilacinum TaxID=33203 RepID=A0A2U3DVT2_PURLI|nr:hypothetical protein PCL_05055 [Purpureocillium lilacinum]
MQPSTYLLHEPIRPKAILKSSTMAHEPHPIPQLLRIPLLYVEPVLALNGALLLFLSPGRFLAAMSPRAASASVGGNDSLADVRVLTDQLAILQLLFAFNVGVLLRATRDAGVWRVACAGMLMSDVLHVLASVRELARGGGQRSVGVGTWRAEEWVNFGVLVGMGLVRLAVVMGVGMRAARSGKDKNKGKTG